MSAINVERSVAAGARGGVVLDWREGWMASETSPTSDEVRPREVVVESFSAGLTPQPEVDLTKWCGPIVVQPVERGCNGESETRGDAREYFQTVYSFVSISFL
jgi:hypothetical protein